VSASGGVVPRRQVVGATWVSCRLAQVYVSGISLPLGCISGTGIYRPNGAIASTIDTFSPEPSLRPPTSHALTGG
jgi:hypothetical protein